MANEDDDEMGAVDAMLPKACSSCVGGRRCIDCQFFRPMCDNYGIIRNFTAESVCKNEQEARAFDRIPTIGEMLDKWYDHYADREFARTNVNGRIGRPRKETRRTMKSLVLMSMSVIGVGRDDKLSAVTRKSLRRVLEWYDAKKSEHLRDPSVKVPSENTVRAYLDCWKALTAKWLREMAEDDGQIVVPRIELPSFTPKPKTWEKPTKRMMQGYKNYVADLRFSNPFDYMMVVFQRTTGCRNGDVNRARWESFSINDGVCYFTYCDSKTQRTSSIPVPVEFFDALLKWRRMMFGSDSPIRCFRSGHEDDPYIFGGRRVEEGGVCVWRPTRHDEAWKRINRGMKACGICDLRNDAHGAYQNRALFGNEIRDQFGEEAMNYAMHNSHRVSLNYSAYNFGKLKGRSIDL